MLLLQILDNMIAHGNPPDVLSREHDDNECAVIRFEWFNGKIKDYPYTRSRYDAVWSRFNAYWEKAA